MTNPDIELFCTNNVPRTVHVVPHCSPPRRPKTEALLFEMVIWRLRDMESPDLREKRQDQI